MTDIQRYAECSPTNHTINVWLHVFGTGLMPDYYPRGTARPVSCYALFEVIVFNLARISGP